MFKIICLSMRRSSNWLSCQFLLWRSIGGSSILGCTWIHSGLGDLYSVVSVGGGQDGATMTMPWTRPMFVFLLIVGMCTASGMIATRRLNAADPAELFDDPQLCN